MGLNLVVEGCAKPGYENEWRRLLERSFGDEHVSEAEIARFREICIPGYERIGAASWIRQRRKPMDFWKHERPKRPKTYQPC